MSGKRIGIGVGVVVLIALGAYAIWPGDDPDDEELVEDEDEDWLEDDWEQTTFPQTIDEDDELAFLTDEQDRPVRWGEGRRFQGMRRGMGMGGRGKGRGRWRNRFDGGPSQEQLQQWRQRRREAFRDRVAIEPRGDAEVTLSADDVLDGLREVRPLMRVCAEMAGGFQAFRSENGRAVSFDVNGEGLVQEGSVTFDPPFEDPEFSSCLENVWSGVQVENAGEDGAGVQIEFPNRGDRGRRGPRGDDDAGADLPPERDRGV